MITCVRTYVCFSYVMFLFTVPTIMYCTYVIENTGEQVDVLCTVHTYVAYSIAKIFQNSLISRFFGLL